VNDWLSFWRMKSGLSVMKNLCQPMAGVCSCFDLTEVNVVLSPRRANSSHFTNYLSVWNVFLITFQNCEILLLYSSSSSLYQTASPQWKIYRDVLGNISKIFLDFSYFIYVWKQIAKMEYKKSYGCLAFPLLLFPTEKNRSPKRVYI